MKKDANSDKVGLGKLAKNAGYIAALYNVQRVVPEHWVEFNQEWLAGYDSKEEINNV